ncbi:MAG: hypothetical protein ACQEV6_05080 [Pseudomonadota bacterium]
MLGKSSVQEPWQQTAREHQGVCDNPAVNYRYLALGLLSARIYTDNRSELIGECAVLDFDREGVALILSEACLKPEQKVRVSLSRKHGVAGGRGEPAISFVSGSVRYVNNGGGVVRAGLQLEYPRSQEHAEHCRHRAIEIENYLERHRPDAERLAASGYRLPEGYQPGGRMRFAG